MKVASRGIGELVRPEVMWGEILRQCRFDFCVGQIFTEILWRSVMGVGLLALSLRSLPLVHIPRFTTRLVKRPLIQVERFRLRNFPHKQKIYESLASSPTPPPPEILLSRGGSIFVCFRNE
ncbi:Uncharacterized protein Fot_55231 [Forsythia ovata]|uniref:Uncharacterized protein n=1 Tax=Forsythia ovata TaxID=205694 RepID=A0ABD1P512_9LAMI